ncbi:pilus assembly protein TadG-related protein [Arthrobacter sp. UYCo732]|uniref:pilus assembly protein TadG-related protein n=1 Tax=Arthrobacter sp. UYCo732 TaxID=3156336 RepID=UPI003399102A
MRRLGQKATPGGRDDERERGVVAPVAALLMVALLGFGALAVDVGAMYSEKAQLQNGADSAALAVADICAKAPMSARCPADQKTQATPYANGNALDGHSNVVSAVVDNAAGTADVKTETPASAGGEHFSLYLARALGINSVEIQATAQARWKYPTTGRAVLPLVFATCEFKDDHSPHKILTHGGGHGAPDCNSSNPSGQIIPGGFAWLKPDGSTGCNVTATIGQWSATSAGGSIPTGCDALFNASLLGKTVALPVYGYTCTGILSPCTGSNVKYMIQKWAGFKVLGWSFPSNNAGPTGVFGPGESGLYGTFVGYSADPSLFTGDSSTSTGNVVVLGLTK